MSWQNEIKPEVKFKSPEGNTFYALWRGNDRTIEKKLGQFDPPNFRGTIVQDLDSKSYLYPLTIYFDGAWHHRDADKFMTALSDEKGQWEVVHPVRGPLILQLVSATEKMAPVEHASYTEIETQWIKPANVTRLVSLTETIGSIIAAAIVSVEDAIEAVNQLKADLYSAIQGALNIFNRVVGFADGQLKNLTATSAIVGELYDSARASYTQAVSAFDFDVADFEAIATPIVNIFSAPINASDDFQSRYVAYKAMIEDICTLAPVFTGEEDVNKAGALEFGVTVTLVSIAQIVATSQFNSRAEVVVAMEGITTVFNDSVAAVETIQDTFANNVERIDQQYFSQTKTYTSLVILYTLCIRALLSQFYSLKAEKTIILKKAESPIAVTVREYGSLGDNDANYDLFLKSNNLSSHEILLLPAGKEILVYI